MNLIEQLGGARARFNSRSLVCGVGYNTLNIPVKVNGKHIPEYVIWREMLRRCYSDNFQNKCPTYKGCYVHADWHNFENFYHDISKMRGYDSISRKRAVNLDKDILKNGNKEYSAKYCRLVPQEINKLITNRKACRGDYPIGVTLSKGKGKFTASLGFVSGEKIKGNVFDDPYEAFLFYKKHKEGHVRRFALSLKETLDLDIFNALMLYEVCIDD